MKEKLVWVSILLTVALPSQAINVQHMKKRIEQTTQRPEQVFAQLAETTACKQLKKPICYTHAIGFFERYAIAQIRRPESEDLYLVFEKQSKSWKLKNAGKFAELKPAVLTVKMEISQASAKSLIQNLGVLR